MSFEEWNETILDAVMNFSNGKKRPKDSGYIPVYGGNGIMDYCNMSNNDGESIIIGRVGAYCGNVYYENRPCWVSDNAILAKAKVNNSAKFLYYKLQDLSLFNMRIGSSQPLLTQTIIKNIVTIIPGEKTQLKIANILSEFDDKIELNNRMNKVLEQMAQAIFKEWFVDFEFPNENGEPYKSSGGEMAESELGMIPKGWKDGLLSDLLVVKYGKDHKKLPDGSIPVYGSGGIMRYVDKALFSSESVLIPRKGTLTNVTFVSDPFWSVDTMFYTEMKIPNIAKFIYLFMKTKDLASMNVGSAVPSMTTAILNNLGIAIPTTDLLLDFDGIVSRFFKRISTNEKHNNVLSNLRDTLLPKLMSGEIDVSEIEI